MAETEQAAVGDTEEGSAPPKKSKKKLIIIAAGALVALMAIGGGGYFFFKKPSPEVQAETVKAKPPVFLEVPDVLVNLQQGAGDRTQYLKVKVTLEIKDQPLADQVKPVLPRVMDIFQTYLRELRPSDLNGSAGMFRLKEELTRRVNLAIAPHHVNAVLFKEIVVQ